MKRSGAKKIDMLNGSIWNKLPLFALPVAATAILEQLFNASDLAVVGNFAGDKSTAAVAAVGANGPVIGLIVNFLIGISLGANVVIANAMGKSESTIKSLFSLYQTGGIINYCNGLKIKEARKLIREGNYNFAQISNLLHFDTPQYFSKCFKKYTKMTPSEYQRSIIS